MFQLYARSFLARRAAVTRRPAVAARSPGFIAPEQLHGLPATPRTDLYGLGCLLYEMLAGEPVFTATSPAGLIRMHLEQAPRPLRRRDVPPQLESLLRRLLGKDPAERPADARQAYDLLLPILLFGGLGAWLSFGYIAARHQRLPWLVTAAAYLALSATAFTVTAVGPDTSSGSLAVVNDIGACLLLAMWPAAIIHALWVNSKSRLPLLRTRLG